MLTALVRTVEVSLGYRIDQLAGSGQHHQPESGLLVQGAKRDRSRLVGDLVEAIEDQRDPPGVD
jgi:hypothetical protein